MNLLLDILAGIYIAAGITLSVFVLSFGVLLLIYAFKRKKSPTAPQVADDDLLSVTIQLPIYNEQYVAARLIDAVCSLDYPPEKFHVQILDDSIDETSDICRERAAFWQAKGIDCCLMQREKREGYKAGALAFGLEQVKTDCVAIFDADFVPSVDFLRRVMPHFNIGPEIGLVQTRWAHLNMDYNWLTRAQAINIDGHFAVEQVARSRGYLPMSMNGTGGVWRVAAIHDAGGWSAATLTEDLDLSYRALVRGWRFVFLVDVPVPGELPPQVAAWKVQQARWATGSTQCLIRHALPLMRSDFPLWKKLMGLAHLSQYAIQPVIFTLFVLTPPLLAGHRFHALPDLRAVGILGAIPPILLVVAQVELYGKLPRNLLYFPVQFVSGAAIVLSNTVAVLRALNINKIQEFKRTPKYRVLTRSDRWAGRNYALNVDWTTLGELALAVYAVWGGILALERFPALAPYLFTYGFSFAAFAYWNFYQTHHLGRQ